MFLFLSGKLYMPVLLFIVLNLEHCFVLSNTFYLKKMLKNGASLICYSFGCLKIMKMFQLLCQHALNIYLVVIVIGRLIKSLIKKVFVICVEC